MYSVKIITSDLLGQESLVDTTVLEQQDRATLDTEVCATPPIYRIPPEVLSMIFIYCPTESHIELPPRRHSLGPELYPWVLGHVCLYWRAVLWSTPEIWQNLKVSACKSQDISIIPNMVQYIIRQTRAPISFDSLYFQQDSILKAIIPTPGRFKDIRLFLTPTSFSTFFNSPSGTFDALEFIAIRCAGFPPSFPSLNTSPLLGAPKLKKVIVQLFRTEYCPPPLLLLPWAQLTHLTLIGSEVFPDIVHRTILRQCTSIVDCKLRIAYGNFTPLTKEVVLPHLQKLHLASHYPLDWDSFLSPFLFPSLENLAVIQPAIPAFTSLISRSGCALQSLTVDAQGADYHELQHLLRASPSLVELQANCIFPPSLFMDISERDLLPHIHRLTTIVKPDGLHAFLDLFERGQENQTLYTSIDHAWIDCRPGPGISNVTERFRRISGEHAHNTAWKNIFVWGLE